MDSISGHSDLEKPISDSVFHLFFWIMAGAFLLIFSFSFKISVIDSKYLSQLAFQNRSVNISVPPPRGILYDRSGEPLVENRPSFDLLAISKSASGILRDQDILNSLALILKVPVEELELSLREKVDSNSIFFAATNLNKNQVLDLEILKLEGFHIIPDTKRVYINGPEFSQIIGYTGKVGKSDLAQDNYYQITDLIGRFGLEAEFENYLRGKHGMMISDQNSVITTVNPEIGNNLVLNIDKDLQLKLYRELGNALTEEGLSRAAAIVQDPRDGSILSLVSFPSFDNNLFIFSLSEAQFRNIFENSAKPLFNRAISGLYNPGSTIKPLIGMMSVQEHILEPADNIRDCVSLTIQSPFDPAVSYTFRNWRNDYGLFNLKRAIAESCNIYFFIAGGGYGSVDGLGISKIADYLFKSFADSILGIDLPGEEKGFVPTPQWKEEAKGEAWYLGDTYNVSIGQGDLLVTPLWLNSYISAVANGGTLYRPRVVNRIISKDGETIKTFKSEELGKLPFEGATIKEMRNSMKETVLSGTAQLLKNLPVSSGAKTGTAEVAKGASINSLFTAFAPFENPEVTITVLIEGSVSNRGLATRAAYNVLNWYFTQGQGGTEN